MGVREKMDKATDIDHDQRVQVAFFVTRFLDINYSIQFIIQSKAIYKPPHVEFIPAAMV